MEQMKAQMKAILGENGHVQNGGWQCVMPGAEERTWPWDKRGPASAEKKKKNYNFEIMTNEGTATHYFHPNSAPYFRISGNFKL